MNGKNVQTQLRILEVSDEYEQNLYDALIKFTHIFEEIEP